MKRLRGSHIFFELAHATSQAPSGEGGGSKCSNNSGGVVGAITPGGGPGGVPGVIGGVPGGVPGGVHGRVRLATTMSTTFSGKPIGKVHADLGARDVSHSFNSRQVASEQLYLGQRCSK